MSNLKPHHRVVIGRNITLSAGALLALTRGLMYATIDPADMNLGQQLVTLDGKILGLWAGVWLAAAVLCIADMVNRHTRYGLSLLVGAAFAWGIGYLIAWAMTGYTHHELLANGMIWMMPAALIFGFLIKVTALQDMLRQRKTSGGARE